MREQRSVARSTGRIGVRYLVLDRLDLYVAGGIFAATLAVYLRTLAPSLLLGDSSELQVLALTPGLAHPTGCPLFLLAARLFTLIPAGDLLWRLNLSSAVFGALAASVLYIACRTLIRSRWAALVGPVCLAISQLYWWEAVMFELYTATALLFASIIACLFVWRQRGHAGWLFVSGVLGGLSPGVHGMVVLAAPAVLLYMALTARRLAAWAAAAAGAATGLAIALCAYLLMDALDPPASYFNVIGRPSSSVWGIAPGAFDSRIDRLTFMISARHFRQYMLVLPEGGLKLTATLYAEVTQSVFAWPVLGLMALGLGTLAWRRRSEAAFIVTAYLTMLVFVLTYKIDEIHAFYIPTHLLLALPASAGAGLLVEMAEGITRRPVHSRNPGSRPSPIAETMPHVAGIAVVGLLIVAAVAPFGDDILSSLREGRITFLDGTPYGEFPYPVRDPEQPRRVASAIVDRLEKDAILFTDWPYLYACIHVAQAERNRTDLAFRMCVPDPQGRLPATCLDYIRASAVQHPIYFTWAPEELQRWFGIREVVGEPRLYRLDPWTSQ